MISFNTVVVLVSTALLGALSGLAGSYSVLRRRALAGDALAHAALPGVFLSFLLLGSSNLLVLLCGALFTGIAGVAATSGLRRFTRIREDAAICIVLSDQPADFQVAGFRIAQAHAVRRGVERECGFRRIAVTRGRQVIRPCVVNHVIVGKGDMVAIVYTVDHDILRIQGRVETAAIPHWQCPTLRTQTHGTSRDGRKAKYAYACGKKNTSHSSSESERVTTAQR